MFTVSFTGYRPEKLPFPIGDNPLFLDLKKRLKDQIEKLVNDGADCFYSGMARGVDIICAEIVLELKEKYPHIVLNALIPCRTQTDGWKDDEKLTYEKIISQCLKKIYIKDKYTKGCMMERNRALVECCDILVAVFDGQKGGTANTVRYAEKRGRKIIIIPPCVS